MIVLIHSGVSWSANAEPLKQRHWMCKKAQIKTMIGWIVTLPTVVKMPIARWYSIADKLQTYNCFRPLWEGNQFANARKAARKIRLRNVSATWTLLLLMEPKLTKLVNTDNIHHPLSPFCWISSLSSRNQYYTPRRPAATVLSFHCIRKICGYCFALGLSNFEREPCQFLFETQIKTKMGQGFVQLLSCSSVLHLRFCLRVCYRGSNHLLGPQHQHWWKGKSWWLDCGKPGGLCKTLFFDWSRKILDVPSCWQALLGENL